MNKKTYLIVFLAFLAISFIRYINQNRLIFDKKTEVVGDSSQPLAKDDLLGKYKTQGKTRYTMLDIYKDTFSLSFYRHFVTTEYSGKWSYENNILNLSYLYKDEDRIDIDASYVVKSSPSPLY
jgi:hypothetical protein